MKKNLYLIGGTMGVGKTSACQILKRKLHRSVFLDGDWCWDMSPFTVNEETKAMVLDNISHLLNNFIACSEYNHVIFCWVMHEQGIINEIIEHLDTRNCVVHTISLVCDERTLAERLKRDVDDGRRTCDIIARTAERLPLYDKLDTEKIDTSDHTVDEVVEMILALTADRNGKEMT